MAVSSEFIRHVTQEAGFPLCGIARCRRLTEREEPFNRWLAAGYDGPLDYMRRHAERRLDPTALVPGAQTVIVCIVPYKNTAWDQTTRSVSPKIASYAYAPDYHDTIRSMLHVVLARIREQYPGTAGRCFVDTAPLLEKAWAMEAGLGWTGRNSLLVTPQFGSFVLLGEVVIDAAAECYDTPFAGERCGNCTACLDSCPVHAIRAPRVIDATRCIACRTIEKQKQGLPADGTGLHGWLFGCDECQSCCPHNARTPMHTLPAFDPVIDPALTTREFWEELDETEFNRIFSHTPLARAGFAAIKAKLSE